MLTLGWSLNNVHMPIWYMEWYGMCAWHFLFMYFVSQCIHWAIPTSAWFPFRNIFMKISIRIIYTSVYYKKWRDVWWCIFWVHMMLLCQHKWFENSKFKLLTFSQFPFMAIKSQYTKCKNYTVFVITVNTNVCIWPVYSCNYITVKTLEKKAMSHTKKFLVQYILARLTAL